MTEDIDYARICEMQQARRELADSRNLDRICPDCNGRLAGKSRAYGLGDYDFLSCEDCCFERHDYADIHDDGTIEEY